MYDIFHVDSTKDLFLIWENPHTDFQVTELICSTSIPFCSHLYQKRDTEWGGICVLIILSVWVKCLSVIWLVFPWRLHCWEKFVYLLAICISISYKVPYLFFNGRINRKMFTWPKAIYRFKRNSRRHSKVILHWARKKFCNSYESRNNPQIAKIIINKTCNFEGITISDIKLYYTAVVKTTAWHQHINIKTGGME